MSDSWAVEFAKQAQYNVLPFVAGCMLDHERVAYRKSFPRSSCMEWLSIDVHIGAQILMRCEFARNAKLRDTEVFARAGEAWYNTPRKSEGECSKVFFWEPKLMVIRVLFLHLVTKFLFSCFAL